MVTSTVFDTEVADDFVGALLTQFGSYTLQNANNSLRLPPRSYNITRILEAMAAVAATYATYIPQQRFQLNAKVRRRLHP